MSVSKAARKINQRRVDISYTALARSLRPNKFASVIGQDLVVKALTHSVKSGNIHHAYLFTGGRGVGKTTLARLVAKGLNCKLPEHGDCCGGCKSCKGIEEGSFLDVIELDAASNRGVEEIQTLFEQLRYPPSLGKMKVIIIDEVHMLSNHAFNSMLKTLEEPPNYVVFILATTEFNKVPLTIVSRCIKFSLQSIPRNKIQDYLETLFEKKNIRFDRDALDLIASSSEGSLRDALSVTEQIIAASGGKDIKISTVLEMLGLISGKVLKSLVLAIVRNDVPEALKISDDVMSKGASARTILDQLAIVFHNVCREKILKSEGEANTEEKIALPEELPLTETDANLFYQICILGKRDLYLAPNELVGLQMTILRIIAFLPTSPESEKKKSVENSSRHQTKVSEGNVNLEKIDGPTKNGNLFVEMLKNVDVKTWPSFVKRLKGNGLVKQFLSQSELVSFDHFPTNSVCHVKIDSSYLMDVEVIKKVNLYVSDRIGSKVEFRPEFFNKLDGSLLKIEQRKKEKAVNEAFKKISKSEIVNAFIRKFDGQIVKGSINNK